MNTLHAGCLKLRDTWPAASAGKTYLFQTPYIDELLTDIGETPARKVRA